MAFFLCFFYDMYDKMRLVMKVKWIKEFMPYAIILVVVILIRTFLVTPIKVHGQSMYNTLEGDEIMILNKLSKFERYDIVVANLMSDGKKVDTLIKRIYGLPGEKIRCENGVLYVNDKKIEDKYGYGKTEDFEEVTLAGDEYFILGDNRAISLDSHIFGPVKESDIEGVTNFVLWPLSKFGALEEK